MTLGYLGFVHPVSAQLEEDGCRLYGTVVDADLGEAIAGASVWLELAGGRSGFLAARTTSADGSFLFEVLPCGAVRLRAQMIGFSDVDERIEFDGEANTRQVTIRLERAPLQLDELRVEVPRSLRLQEVGFYARKAWEESTGEDYGQFLDPDEVEGRAAAFSTVAGIALSTRIRFIYGGCRPSVYVNGRRITRRYNFWRWVDLLVKPRDVEGIEVYRAVWGAVPPEFRDFDSRRCGAVVIWKKNRRED